MKRWSVGGLVSLLLALALAAGLLAGCDPTGTTQVVEEGHKIQEKALDATTSANLRIIDSAIQVYYAENGEWPTSMSQLSSCFGGKPPSDPRGRTYYIKMVDGEAKAAVK